MKIFLKRILKKDMQDELQEKFLMNLGDYDGAWHDSKDNEW